MTDIVNRLRGPAPSILAMRDAADEIDAQAAKIARLKAAHAWQPIETAPKDGTAILVSNERGAWLAKYEPAYASCYRPENPWFSLMLNHDHMRKGKPYAPTHWMPLPAAPAANHAPCDAGEICIDCQPRRADGSCPDGPAASAEPIGYITPAAIDLLREGRYVTLCPTSIDQGVPVFLGAELAASVGPTRCGGR